MNQEFNKESERSRERRSRKNPKMCTAEQTSAAGSAQRRSALQQTSAAYEGGLGKRTASGLTPQAESKIIRARRRRRIIAMIIAECFALIAIFGYAYVAKRLNNIQRPEFNTEVIKNPNLNVATVEKMKGYWTIAIFGVDDRGKILEKYTNADVNMICNINMDTGEIRMISVFRDSYLNISEDGSYNKMNQAYFLGGPQQAVSALNRNLDLDITHYVTFNWKGVAEAINILGGVDIEISKAEFYYINSFITETVEATGIGSHHLKQAGMNHLDGVQAVAYARLRKMDNDFARTERQRKVIAQLFEKAKEADIGVLNNIVEVLFDGQIATNVSIMDAINMALNISKYHLGESTGFPMARGDVNMGKRGAVVVPLTLETNVVGLHQFLFDEEEYTTTTTVKNISAKIAADTGMYKEGNYIYNVPTDSGVIQATKQAASETTKASESGDSESGSSTRTTESETDESGNIVTKSATNPTRETDEDGNTIAETSESAVGPTASTEVTRPGSTISSSESRPGTKETTAPSPGSTTATTEGAAGPGSTETISGGHPGTSIESPGSTTETTISWGPGSTAASPGSNTSEGPGSGSSSAEGVSSVSPGTQSTEIPIVSGPGA